MPLLFLLVAFFDFGLALFIRTTLQHSVREGVRYAVTYRTASGSCQDASIKSVVQRQSIGFLAGEANRALIHVRYFDPISFSEIDPPGGNYPGNIVEVAVEGYQYNWIAPVIWGVGPYVIQVRSHDRMEGLAGGTNPPCR